MKYFATTIFFLSYLIQNIIERQLFITEKCFHEIIKQLYFIIRNDMKSFEIYEKWPKQLRKYQISDENFLLVSRSCCLWQIFTMSVTLSWCDVPPPSFHIMKYWPNSENRTFYLFCFDHRFILFSLLFVTLC